MQFSSGPASGGLTMNERIRELAEQAGYTPLEPRAFADDLQEIFLEKFAKSIVKECIKACQSRVGNSDYNTGRMHCVSDIKDHFGMK